MLGYARFIKRSAHKRYVNAIKDGGNYITIIGGETNTFSIIIGSH